MPDLAYILRHPIQEARIAMKSRPKSRQKLPWERGRWARRRTFWRFGQWVARHLSTEAWRSTGYCDDIRPDLIGEDQDGYIVAAARRADWWEPFDVRKPRHIAAAIRSGRARQVNFLDLERG